MNRCIDADMLIKKYIDTDIKKFSNSDVKIVLENLKQNILKESTIELVRCGECKKADTRKCPFYSAGWGYTDKDYCSCGERKENE